MHTTILVAFLLCAINSYFVIQGQTTMAPFTMDVLVMWYNKKASPGDCDDYETAFVYKKLKPDLNLILYRNGYQTIAWDFTCTYPTANCDLLEEEADRELVGLCDTCLCSFPKSYCNAMYNCGFRHLRV